MTSRAWFVDRVGGPERLTLREREDAAPGAGEVSIRVSAIGLNFADLFVRAGVYPRTPSPPFVPGMEISGVIEACGEGVSGLSAGEAVAAVPIFGGHAERVVCPATHVFPLPVDVDFAEAAAIPVAFLTAHHILSESHVEKGERVVVTAAAGGVGTALLQLLSRGGARSLALVGSEKKLELCRGLGAEDAATYPGACRALDRLFEGRADVVADAIGGVLFRRLWRRVARGGRYVLYGFAAASKPKGLARIQALRELSAMGFLFPYSFVQSCRSLIGFNLSLLPGKTESLRTAAEEIFREWKRGSIRPILGPRFRFEDLPAAHRALAGRGTTGKVIVTLSSTA